MTCRIMASLMRREFSILADAWPNKLQRCSHWGTNLRRYLDARSCRVYYRDGGEIILVPNGSPFEAGKTDMRVHHAVARVVESKRPLVYLNQIGGQDELVFDGASFIMNADRTISWQLPAWQENLAITHWKEEVTAGYVNREIPVI